MDEKTAAAALLAQMRTAYGGQMEEDEFTRRLQQALADIQILLKKLEAQNEISP